MKITHVLFAAGLLSSQASSALTELEGPALDQWGTGASSVTLACASFSTTCSTGTSPVIGGDYEDNLFTSFSTSSVSTAQGSGMGTSQIVDTSGIDTIKLTGQAQGTAKTSGNVGGIGDGEAWGLIGYTYNGPGATISLDVNLSGTVSNPIGSGFSEIVASVYIIDPLDWEFTLGGFSTDASGYFGEGLFPIAEAFVSLEESGIDSDSIELMLETGDSFYVWAFMNVGAGAGGTSSSLNSLDMSFSDNSNLIANSSAVPLPAAAWLLFSGMFALLGFRKN